jgi:hypothetical protein
MSNQPIKCGYIFQFGYKGRQVWHLYSGNILHKWINHLHVLHLNVDTICRIIWIMEEQKFSFLFIVKKLQISCYKRDRPAGWLLSVIKLWGMTRLPSRSCQARRSDCFCWLRGAIFHSDSAEGRDTQRLIGETNWKKMHWNSAGIWCCYNKLYITALRVRYNSILSII